MKIPFKRITIAAFCLILFCSTGLAESRYVTDKWRLPLRSGPGTKYKILAIVESGQKLEVVKPGDDWSLVRLANGKEGYVLKRYMVSQPTSAVRLKQLKIKHEDFKLHADGAFKENVKLKAENKNLQDSLHRNELVHKKLRGDYEKLEKSAKLHAEGYLRENAKLKEENKNLKDLLHSNESVLNKLHRDYEELKKTAQSFAAKSPPPQTDAGKVVKTTGARWAVVIGVSDYQDSKVPTLRYAAADAQSFYNWLVNDGGRYAPTRVRLLLNQKATYVNIKETLFEWLKQALEEDVITIFFAGHGSPESPDSQKNLYLLPYDVDYDRVATTGFPMWDIETALKRFIKAKKVIVIADACHAGGVGRSFDIARRANRGISVNPVSSGLQNLSSVNDGVCIISASADNQYSQESMDWGGGHGVFTYFLLKGLKGEADYNNDQRTSLGEIVPFLSEHVRRATQNAQSPTVAGRFDPALSIGN